MAITEGQVFGRWTVLGAKGRKVPCRCSCGSERVVDKYSLLDGRSVSCGCHRDELSAARGHDRLKHPVEAGDRFGRWLVLDASDRAAVRCRCDCGAERQVPATNLVNGLSQSCGCYKRDELSANPHNVKHGLSRHELGALWYQIIGRCENPRNKQYKDYGGRGITLYGPWHDLPTFIRDVEAAIGPRPDGLTLDRINNDDGYVPGNLRWADMHIQRMNQRRMMPAARAGQRLLF